MTIPKKNPYVRLTPDKLNVLSDLVVDNIEDIFDHFCVKCQKGKKFYYGPCPIHDGDGHTNPFNLYYDGTLYRGNWKCRSHGCERVFKKTAIGCVRGLLSHNDYKWHQPGDRMAGFHDTVNWLFEFFKTDGKKLNVNRPEVEKKKFINSISWTVQDTNEAKLCISLEDFRRTPTLKFSSAYLKSRGYDISISEKYDIAECSAIGKEMSDRLVFPIFDDSHRYVIGVTGRTLYPQCGNCKLYHKEGVCPSNNYIMQYKKWRHNKGFAAENNLFNFWYAKEYINRLHSVVLVESPFNVLRLEQAGVKNSVGTFGTYLNDSQLNKLFGTELYTVNLLYDNDEAGNNALSDIVDKISRIFNVNVIKLPQGINDVGDMMIEDVKRLIVTQIRNH